MSDQLITRSQGDLVYVPAKYVNDAKKKYPHKGIDQQRGFALDAVEKERYAENWDWEVAPDDHSEYDVKRLEIHLDYKLVSAKSLTISTREISFAKEHDWAALVHRLEEVNPDGSFTARVLGTISYETLSQGYLNPSDRNPGKSVFAWLDQIEHLIK